MSSHALLLRQIDALSPGVAQRDLQISALRLAIDKLTLELFHLRRMRYGRSSEKVDSAHSEVQSPGVALVPAGDAGQALQGAPVADLEDARQKRQAACSRAAPQQLPGHLPRQEVMHLASRDCTCPGCGTALRQIGQDTSKVLEYPARQLQGHAPRAPQVRLRPLPHHRAGARAEPPH
ncbi:MAG: IS66 family transposase zinc-finger binding domain-containing protein [Polaromonas sp.]